MGGRMPKIFCDFETRSELSVKDVGAWKYVEHPSTYPLMFAYGVKGDMHQWLQYKHGTECPESWADIVADPSIAITAHNCGFEIAVYQEICVGRYGWPEIDLSRWRDTAAKGTHANQPRALGNLCERIGTKERKDKYGKYLLNTLAIPQRTVKAKTYSKDTKDGLHKKGEIRKDSVSYLEEHGIELFELDDKKGLFYWNNEPKLLSDLAKYNRQDIVAEQEADAKLPHLPKTEQMVWELDQQINARGIPIDRELCEGVTKIFEVEAKICNEAIKKIAHEDDGRPDKMQVTACTQNKRIVEWVNQRVNFGPSLNKDIVGEWMKKPWGVKDEDEAERVRQVLTLKGIAGGTGVKKYWSALDFIQADNRVRGQLLYYGAATGRWAGKGIQPHNMVRMPIPEEIFFEAITRGDHAEVAELAELFDYTVMGLLKTCIRGMVRAEEGKRLIVSDFAGIESRVLQWVAGNESALQLFRDGADMYVHAASQIFGIPYDEMMELDGKGGTHCKKEFKEKRQVGKIAVLALGYGMGGAKYQGTCENFGVKITESFAQDIVYKWRNANPLVTDLWKRVERACKAVIKNKKVKARIDNYLTIFWDQRGYLCIRLPSGRVLYYFRARIDKESGQIQYLDGGKQWVDTYGGKLIENLVQAISRDLLVNSAFVADEMGLNLIFHVHDELVAEESLDNVEAYDMLHKAMETLPTWAAGLPLAAETYQQERYTK